MSSFIADLLGSVAKAGADTLDDITKQNARERERDAEMRLQNELALKRAEEAEKLRIKLEDDRALAKQKRLSEQSQEVEAAAPAVTAARQLGEAQSRAPSVDSNVLDIIKSKLTPEQLKKYYGVDTGPVAAIDDRLGVARQKGYYDIESSLKSARSETVSALRQELKDRQEQYRLDQADRKGDQRDRQLDIMASKVANSGGGGGGANKVHSSFTDERGYRINSMTDGSLSVARDENGKPIVAESFGKRVDAKVKELTKAGGKYRNMEQAELRKIARDSIQAEDGVGTSVAPARANQFKVIRP